MVLNHLECFLSASWKFTEFQNTVPTRHHLQVKVNSNTAIGRVDTGITGNDLTVFEATMKLELVFH